MVINLKKIPPETVERLFNVALPLLTGLKYKTKVRKIKQINGSHPINIDLEITETPVTSANYESVKKNFEIFIDDENFLNRFRDSIK